MRNGVVQIGPRSSAAPAGRVEYVDAIKVAMVIVVIAAHVAITYGAQGGWFYTEPTGVAAFRLFMDLTVAVGSLFAMGSFFFLAGIFVPGSVARKGRRRYIVDRIVRLGAPFALFVVVVVPLVQWGVAAAAGGPSLRSIVTVQLHNLGSGPLWFVGVLLLFCVAAALVLGGNGRAATLTPITLRPLLWCAAAVAAGEFTLRLAFPIESNQLFSAHVWQWGQCGGLFALGIVAGRRGWLHQQVPEPVRRACVFAALTGMAALIALLVLNRDHVDPFRGGVTWQSLTVAVLEGVVAVLVPILMLAAFAPLRSGPMLRAVGRSAFGAYLVQTPILVAVALLLRPIEVDPAVKLVILLPAGVLLCFLLAWWMTRLTVLRRFL